MINVSDLVAIDMHTHVKISATEPEDPLTKQQRLETEQLFKTDMKTATTAEDVALYYRRLKMAAVVFSVDSEAGTGEVPVRNEEVAEIAAAYPDVLIPFASIDPWKGKSGARQARNLIENHGVKGFKFHPSMQEFFPNDRHAYTLYEVIEEARLPALFHTGQSGIGMGQRGGGGIRLKYSNPMCLDDVAVDFPDMPIVLAHPSAPWQDEAIEIAKHKPQVYIDLSGWLPKYFPPALVHHANTLLRDKILFGSDFPFITPERWLSDFEQAGFRDEVKPLILKENAARLLQLD
jgi:uncharacterized protein